MLQKHPTDGAGSPQRRVKVTRDYQRLPKITQNEILKVSRLPGEGGKLHPCNPERAARQNPDVKERPRLPRGKPRPPPTRQRRRHRCPAADKPTPSLLNNLYYNTMVHICPVKLSGARIPQAEWPCGDAKGTTINRMNCAWHLEFYSPGGRTDFPMKIRGSTNCFAPAALFAANQLRNLGLFWYAKIKLYFIIDAQCLLNC